MSAILLVEDDLDIRIDLADLLRHEGYEVATVANGQEALDWLRQAGHHADLILLDLMMPIMNGWDFRSQQLEEPSLTTIPVVLLSGAGDVARHAMALKTAGYLIKPLRLDSLLHLVARFCDQPAAVGTA
ncbi:MAG TPA: response regulator [Kofleriaceae bacterium]|nr:response regulator [Kofleriaceae bacterium]